MYHFRERFFDEPHSILNVNCFDLDGSGMDGSGLDGSGLGGSGLETSKYASAILARWAGIGISSSPFEVIEHLVLFLRSKINPPTL